MAIYRAIVHGRSPQIIISDHWNHVRSLLNMEFVGLSPKYWNMAISAMDMLHAMSPHLDVWRCIIKAIQRRGGMQVDGSDMLWFGWKKAHTRASVRESAHENELRRGNAAADNVANAWTAKSVK